MLSSGQNLLRRKLTHEDGRVAFVELFFDLVFVFAITLVSHVMYAATTVILVGVAVSETLSEQSRLHPAPQVDIG